MNWHDWLLTNYKFILIYVMLGITMIWTGYIVEPILHILDRQIIIANYSLNAHDDIQANVTTLKEKLREHDAKLDMLLNMTNSSH